MDLIESKFMRTLNIKLTLVLCLALLQISCYKDETTLDTNQLSEIEIDLPNVSSSVVHMDKNETLEISPIVTQSGDKPLTYEWEIDYEVVSTEAELIFFAADLGEFPVRLKVSNEDGSAFATFTLHVE